MNEMIGLGVHTGMGAQEPDKMVQECEKAEFDSIWISEDPNCRDVFSFLIGLAASEAKKVNAAS